MNHCYLKYTENQILLTLLFFSLKYYQIHRYNFLIRILMKLNKTDPKIMSGKADM